METISNYPGISLLALEKRFKIKSRQLEYQLKVINSILYDASEEPLHRENKRVWLKTNDTALNNILINLRAEQISTKNISKKNRLSFIAILIAKENNMTLQKIADTLLISKNTALNDINLLKKDIARNQFLIDNSKKNGYFFVGKEIEIRKYLITIIQNLLNYDYEIHEIIDIINLDINSYYSIEEELELFEKETHIRFSDNQFFALSLFGHLMTVRIKNNHHIDLNSLLLKKETEFDYLENILRHYSIINFSNYNERIYFSIQVYSANVISSKLTNDSELNRLVSQMITYVEKQLVIKFVNKEELLFNLTNHIKPAIYRHKFGTPYNDELINNFETDYYNILPIVLEAINIIEKNYEVEFTETEIFYVGLIFKNFFSKEENHAREKEVQAIVLCENGLSVSSLLFETLSRMFPNINFISHLSIRDFLEKEVIYKNIDIVFSTSFIETKKVLFIVSPLMKEAEKTELMTVVNQRFFGRNDLVDISGLIKIIKKNTHVENTKLLEEEIYQHFHKKNKTIETSSNFNTLLTLDKIKFTKRKFTFEEAMWAVAEPLLNENFIQKSYVDKIITNYDENYPYFVIAPEIAMPHSDYQSGVNKLGFSLLKLEHPVRFSDKLFVSLILMVTPIDNHGHRDAINAFYDLVSQQEHRDSLLQTTNKYDLKKYLELYIK